MDFTKSAVRLGWRDRILAIRTEAEFNLAAIELFRVQRKRNPIYRRLCDARKISEIKSWREIPAVPQRLFKETRVFGARVARLEFHTSGTTTGRPGVHRMRDEVLYRAVTEAGFCWNRKKPWRMIFLHPNPKRAPHSSLSQMLEWWKVAFGSPESISIFREGLDLKRLERELNSLSSTPVFLAGTAFSFVHLLDSWSKFQWKLPAKSVVMETGGYKGRSRELEKGELYSGIRRLFGVKDRQIWNEYGMTELSSQAYAQGFRGEHRPPPWARVLVMDPVRECEVKVGARGVVRWIDLANVDSVLAVQTLDLAVRTVKGFRLLGRVAEAERRGCSLGMDSVLKVVDKK